MSRSGTGGAGFGGYDAELTILRCILTLSPVGNCSYLTTSPGPLLEVEPSKTQGHTTKSGEMKTASRLDRKVQLAFGAAILSLVEVGAVSYRGVRVSRCVGCRRLDV